MSPLEAYRKFWAGMLTYNGHDTNGRHFSASVLILSLLASMISLVFYSNILIWAIMLAVVFFLVHGVVYMYLLLGVNSRAEKVEEVLPDFLELMASNIRSGLTPDKALIVSAREEFGPLADAVWRAGKHSITGMPLDLVMLGMNENIRSNALEKTTHLIVEGLHSGGDLSELLSKTALYLRKFRSVRREINSIILNYVLFIVAAITFGAPMLYGVSTFLVNIMLVIRGKIGPNLANTAALSAGISIFKGKLLLTPESILLFSIAAIIITVFFGCMAVGVMMSGRRVEGLKYFPMLSLISIAVLFAIRAGLEAILGSMVK